MPRGYFTKGLFFRWVFREYFPAFYFSEALGAPLNFFITELGGTARMGRGIFLFWNIIGTGPEALRAPETIRMRTL